MNFHQKNRCTFEKDGENKRYNSEQISQIHKIAQVLCLRIKKPNRKNRSSQTVKVKPQQYTITTKKKVEQIRKNCKRQKSQTQRNLKIRLGNWNTRRSSAKRGENVLDIQNQILGKC